MTLAPTTKLRCAPGVRVDLGSGGEAKITLGGVVVRGGPHALAVLDAFAAPVSFEAALAALGPRAKGAEDSIGITRTILQLADAGVLVDDASPQATRAREAAGFDAPAAHVMMLDDRARTACFLGAIASVVREGDVVIDLGTGTGILAVAAARAGARHVYAIEARGVGSVAREVFAQNGVADRVTLVEGWSTQVTLPERANVLVSEILGDELLGERVVESFRDALQRLLTPDARILPESARLSVSLFTAPAEVRRARTPTREALDAWRAWYGVDLAPFAHAAAGVAQPFFEDPRRCAEWPSVADAADLGAIEFRAVDGPSLDRTARVKAHTSGRVDALLVHYDLQVAPGHALSLAPSRATAANHWRMPLWLLGTPLDVAAGDAIVVRYRTGGADAGVTAAIVRA